MTPIRSRKTSGTSPNESPNDVTESSINQAGLGRRLSNFLSTWMPGASVSVGRARGAELAREDHERITRSRSTYRAPDDVEEGILSAANHTPIERVQSPQGTHQKWNKPRASIPSDFLASPSPHFASSPYDLSNASKSARRSIVQPSHALTRVTPPKLRHAATSPNLKRPRDGPSNRSRRSPVSPRGGADNHPRGRQLTVRDENVPKDPFLAPPGLSKPKSRSRARTSRRNTASSRRNTVTPASAVAPVLKTEEVVCRSTPHSRSVSRVRGSNRYSANEDIPPVPPLLSAAVVEDSLNAWLQIVESRGSASPNTISASAVDGEEDDDVDPGLGHILFSRLSGAADVMSSSRSSSGSVALRERPTDSPTPSSTASLHSSTLQYLAPPRPDAIRRERSIQSLRAHLVPSRQRSQFFTANGVEQGGASRTRRPSNTSWLDGPEWSGAMHKPGIRDSRRTSKRGLIPWFGGEHAFLERSEENRHTPFDDHDE